MTRYLNGFYTVINKEKYIGNNTPYARSSWEFAVMRFLDTNTNVIKWANEVIKIKYFNSFTHKYTIYIPDFIVTYKDKHGVLFTEILEVKPKCQTLMGESKKKSDKTAAQLNAMKWKAAVEFAESHGMKFRVITEDSIW